MTAKKFLKVRISEYSLCGDSAHLKSFGLGSCVGLVIWDPKKKIGGMAHILLPASKNHDHHAETAKYAAGAVAVLSNELDRAGCRVDRLVAKIAGGANMFAARFNMFADESGLNIGKRNVRAVKQALARRKIPLVAQEVGGELGRTIEFDPASGALTIYRSSGEVIVI
jgi:chemotaxis protein CheD